jgi:hypothetical protein
VPLPDDAESGSRAGIAAVRRIMWLGIGLLACGIAVIFVPIALLVHAVAAGISGDAPGDLSFVLYALPVGAILGLVLLTVGAGMLARAFRAGRG